MTFLVFALLITAGAGLTLAGIYARREKRADELAKTAYQRGFDACSRIRDREEVQARKEVLLSSSRSPEKGQIVVEHDSDDSIFGVVSTTSKTARN